MIGFSWLNLLFQNEKLEPAAYDGDKLRRWGWYMYLKGEIRGPLNLVELSPIVSSAQASGEPIWVAQKGFKKWHSGSVLMEELSQVDRAVLPNKRRENQQVTLSKQPNQKSSEVARRASRAQLDLEGVQDQDQAQQHFQMRARLRLGRLVSPWKILFQTAFLPFWGWTSWLEESFVESVYHLGDSGRRFPRRFGLSWIPVLHFWLAHQLALLVCAIEQQNNYKKTSLWLALVFSAFPPLFAFYIQRSLTQHWKLHVQHAVKKISKSTESKSKLRQLC